jgi:SAM-dependent methyltransferase
MPGTNNADTNLTGHREVAAQIACPVCGAFNFEQLFIKRDETFVRCTSCTLMLINPPPDLSVTTATYDEDYSQTYIRKAPKKLKRCVGWVRRVQKKFVRKGKWLDVGCSAGFVVKAATDLGFDAYGVELEPAAVKWAGEVLNLANVRCGLLEEQRYDAASFDVISLYDVIEHVPDLNRLLAELYRILAPGGIIEIRTPDVGHWRTPKKLSQWKEVKPSEHLYYFNLRTIQKLFESHHFRIAYRRPMFNPALDIYFRKSA